MISYLKGLFLILALVSRLPMAAGEHKTFSFSPGEGKSSRPNILFIVSEDNGMELGCYGAPVRTPHLDKLASSGIRFGNAYVPQAGCSPSRASFFTGLYPHQNGQIGLATWKYSMYNPEPPIFINDLKTSGYRTGMIGKIHVNPESALLLDWHKIKGANFNRKDPDNYAVAAFEFMSASEEPFFLQVNFPDAHRPFLRQVEGKPGKPLTGKDVKVLPYMGVSSDKLKQETADYYNCMMRLDQYIGDLLAKLKETGKYDNTLIVYMGDHGADILRGKRTSYEGGLRIPLIIHWPGVGKPGVVYNDLVSSLDLYPTFMEACGISIPGHLPGKSLIPAIKGNKKPVREYLFAEYNVHSNHNPYPQRSVRGEKYKLIHNLCAGYTNPGYNYTISDLIDSADFVLALEKAPQKIKDAYQRMKAPPEFELYDLSKDPYEWNNLAYNPEYATVLQQYQSVLKAWQKETKDPFLDKELAERFLLEVLATKEKKLDLKYHEYMNPH